MTQFSSLKSAGTIPVFLVSLASIVVIIAALRAAQSLVNPFLMAAFITIILIGPLRKLQRRGVRHWIAVSGLSAAMVIVLFVISLLVGGSINSFRDNLPEYQQKLSERLDTVNSLLASRGFSLESSGLAESISPSRIFTLAGDLMAGLGSMLGNSFLILLAVVFLLAEAAAIPDRFRSQFADADSKLRYAREFITSANEYMLLKAGISALTGVIVGLCLWLLDIDFAVVWALLAFFLNFVPNIGSIIAAVPAVLLAFVQHGVTSMLLTSAVYLVVNVVVGNIIEPRFMGKGVGLSTFVVFASLVFWGWVLGPIGMLLSVPLTMLLKIGLSAAEETRSIAGMLGPSVTDGDDPAQKPG